MEVLVKLVGGFVLVVIMTVVIGLIMSLPVYWLWNGILPDLFGFKEISWLQAWGLLILCGFLFKSSATTKSE